MDKHKSVWILQMMKYFMVTKDYLQVNVVSDDPTGIYKNHFWLVSRSNVKYPIIHISDSSDQQRNINIESYKETENKIRNLVNNQQGEVLDISINESATDYNLEHIFKAGMLPEMFLNPMEAEDLLETYKGNYLEMEIQLENEVNNLPSFINFLEKAAIWKNKKRKETSFPRFYFFDAGVARSIAHMSLPTETMTEFGVLFETYIMMEITTYIDYSGLSRTELTYYRLGSGKREVDFIIGDDVAIEVKSAKTIQDKHLVSLRELKEEGIFSSYIVVSREEIPRMLSDGILVLPWKEFLMKLWNGEIYGSKS